MLSVLHVSVGKSVKHENMVYYEFGQISIVRRLSSRCFEHFVRGNGRLYTRGRVTRVDELGQTFITGFLSVV